jgi:hypothetical protein
LTHVGTPGGHLTTAPLVPPKRMLKPPVVLFVTMNVNPATSGAKTGKSAASAPVTVMDW